jgi:hypothetical protein
MLRQTHADQRGAALLLTMLMMVIMFIVITSMLSVVGNEVVISGLHRDSALAFEYAQSGLEEALRRMQAGHPFQPGFTGSIGDVKVAVNSLGGSLYEVRSQAVAGRAQRRVTQLVELQTVAFPGDVIFGQAINQDSVGASDIVTGDVYARTFIKFKEGDTTVSDRLTYAGWRISRCEDPEKAPVGACAYPGDAPSKITPCYTHAQCTALGLANWYPGTRRAEYQATPLGAEIAAKKTMCPDGGGGSLPGDTVPAGAVAADGATTFTASSSDDLFTATVHHSFANDTRVLLEPLVGNNLPGGASAGVTYYVVNASGTTFKLSATPGGAAINLTSSGSGTALRALEGQPLYGFDRDDRDWQGNPITPAQAVTGQLPCGLPYKWVAESYGWEKSDPPPTVTRWFKTIVFDQWFANYWTVDTEGRPVKNDKLKSHLEFGAIPGFPPIDTSIFDEKRTGGGQLNEDSGLDWGCKYAEMWNNGYPPGDYPPEWCVGYAQDHPIRLVLSGGNWEINGNVKGHGLMLVTEAVNFNIVSNFRYWGTIIVDGTQPVMLGSGNVTIHGGGLITRQKVTIGANTVIYAGEGVPGAPTGLSFIVARAWWER